MRSWRKTPLKEITIKIGSGSTPRGGGETYKSSGISLIRSQNVLDIKFSMDGLAFIDEIQAHELRNVTIENDDILLNITGDSVGRCCKVPNHILPARVNQHVCIIRAEKKKLNPHFLMYSLYKQKEELLVLAEIGATRNALTKSIIEDFQIDLPSIQEQTAIAEILSSLDDKIDLLHKQNETLEQLAETLFRQWFIEECEESWKEILIKEVSISNSETLRNNFTYSEIEYLDTGSITKGKIEAWQHFSKNERPSRAQRLVKPLDIIYSLVRPNHLHYGILLYPKVNSVVSTGFTVITATSISPYFLYYYLTSKDIVEYLSIIAEGSTSAYPSLRPSDIECLSFPRPPQEKVEKFHSLVNELWEKINLNQRQIKHLECTRDTLLPKLMSGEIRVNLAEV